MANILLNLEPNDFKVIFGPMGTYCGLVKKLYNAGYFATQNGFYNKNFTKVFGRYPRNEKDAKLLYLNVLNLMAKKYPYC